MIGQIGAKAVALAGKYGPQLVSTAKSAASKLGSTQIGQKATAAAKNKRIRQEALREQLQAQGHVQHVVDILDKLRNEKQEIEEFIEFVF